MPGFSLVSHLRLSSLGHLAVVHESTTADLSFLYPLLAHASISSSSDTTITRAAAPVTVADHVPPRLILLSTTQLFLHYNLTCRKLGTLGGSLASLGPDRLLFIDALSQLYNTADAVESAAAWSVDPARPSGSVRQLHFGADALKFLLQAIQKHMEEQFERGSCLILVDDLMPFVYAGVPAADVVEFVRRLVKLAESTNSTLVTQAQSDLALPAADLLVHSLPLMADLILVCKGLPSGYSRDVHGQITVVHGRRAVQRLLVPGVTGESLPVPVQVQFKVVDKGVEFFGSGLSGAVV